MTTVAYKSNEDIARELNRHARDFARADIALAHISRKGVMRVYRAPDHIEPYPGEHVVDLLPDEGKWTAELVGAVLSSK